MRKWFGGIISALAGGCVTGATTMVIDPAKFNFQQGFGNVLLVIAFTAGLQIFSFLQKSPLPDKNGEIK